MFGARSRGAALATIALAVGAVLSGCVESDPKPTRTPTPTATPLFSSDAEALAAAKASYQRYVDVVNALAASGWKEVGPLSTVEVGAALRADTSAASTNAAKGIRTEGQITFYKLSVQEIGARTVRTYICLDVSGTRVIASDGTDVTSPDRTPVIPIVVRFEKREAALLVARSDQWDGKSFC